MTDTNTPPDQGKAGMIGLAIALLVVGLVAGYAMGKGADRYETKASPTPEVATMPGWQTFASEEHSFEFQYPSEAIVVEDPENSPTLDSLYLTLHDACGGCTDGMTITMHRSSMITDLRKAYTAFIVPELLEVGTSASGIINTSFNGYPALFYRVTPGDDCETGCNISQAYLLRDPMTGTFIEIWYDQSDRAEDYQRILDSFKFNSLGYEGQSDTTHKDAQFAEILRVEEVGGKRTVVVDFADWLTGAEADAYYRAQGDVGGAPNGYAIRNAEYTRTTLPVAANATFKRVDYGSGDGVGQVSISFKEFKELFGNDLKGNREGWFTIENGVVTAFEEQYRP